MSTPEVTEEAVEIPPRVDDPPESPGVPPTYTRELHIRHRLIVGEVMDLIPDYPLQPLENGTLKVMGFDVVGGKRILFVLDDTQRNWLIEQLQGRPSVVPASMADLAAVTRS